MACQDDALIQEVPGNWIKKSTQNPPNASQANRNAAQASADAAADAAGDKHCETGACPGEAVCAGVRNPRVVRTYSFEDGTFGRTHYIRCKVTARYHCECPKPPAKDDKKKDKKKGKKRSRRR